jgi:hypothetical protein
MPRAKEDGILIAKDDFPYASGGPTEHQAIDKGLSHVRAGVAERIYVCAPTYEDDFTTSSLRGGRDSFDQIINPANLD